MDTDSDNENEEHVQQNGQVKRKLEQKGLGKKIKSDLEATARFNNNLPLLNQIPGSTDSESQQMANIANQLPSPTTSSDNVKEKKHETPRFATYEKLGGTTDQGKEYEKMMSAHLALKLIKNNEIVDFGMTTNDKANGLFDDIGLKVKFKNKKTVNFLFQLKHKEKPKHITQRELFGVDKNFSVEKYFKSIMASDNKLSHDDVCILYTNCPLIIENSTHSAKNFKIEKCHHLEHEELFLNSESAEECSIFRIMTKDKNHTFYLLAGQSNLESTKKKTKQMLQDLVDHDVDIYDHFVHFMGEWWSQNFVLDKNDVIAKLTELALTPHMKSLSASKQNSKTVYVEEAIMEFRVTIVDDDMVDNIWQTDTHERSGEVRKKFALNSIAEDKVLWYLGKVPLVVKIDGSNQAKIKRVLELMNKSSEMKQIVLVGDVTSDFFEELDSFQNLADLIGKSNNKTHCREILETFQVSLQGRKPISLEKLIKINPDIAKHIGVGELLKMSQETYLIGNHQENLPDFHIPRSVSSIFVKTEMILNVFEKQRNQIVVIINGDLTTRNAFSTSSNFDTVELSEYLNNNSNRCENVLLLSTEKQCTLAEFNQVCTKNKRSRVNLFQVFDEEVCILLTQSEKQPLDWPATESRIVMEQDILRKFDNSPNVIFAPPGMGKSTLKQVLYNNCPEDHWGIRVDLINYNSFLAQKPSVEEMEESFLGIDDAIQKSSTKQIKRCVHTSKKVYFFLDGLDEVDRQYVKYILNFVLEKSKNSKIWLSSRENLRDEVSKILHTVPVEINELNKNEQEDYIRKKLKIKYKGEEIETILSAVSTNTDLSNSQELLGIPLQLYILTEIFLNNEDVYKNLEEKNIFVLTQMYKIFFEGKLNSAICKIVEKSQRHQLGYLKPLLYPYEIPALKQCLGRKDFEKLNVELEETQEFVGEIKNKGDKFGIIKKINESGQAIFVHQTYAEYFACVWLKKNKSKTTLLREVIFSRKYQILRLMFDVMLAENNPLHLSIIYKNIDMFEKHINEKYSRDQGGRTALHLCCTYGIVNPSPKIRGMLLCRDRTCHPTMTDKMTKECHNIYNKDDLFNLDLIEYSLKAEYLYPIERFLEIGCANFEDIKTMLYDSYEKKSLLYYSAQEGFPKLFHSVISENPELVDCQISCHSLLEIAVWGTHIENIWPRREGNIAVVKILLQRGVNINSPLRRSGCSPETFRDKTILDIACEKCRYDMIDVLVQHGAKCSDGYTVWHWISELKNCDKKHLDQLLKEFDADVNAKNDKGTTALHLACERNSFLPPGITTEIKGDHRDIVEFLIKKGADVNAINCDGMTPLSIAGKNGDIEVINMLLQNGASIIVILMI
ncbi:hypothetical protein Zmor_018704 [Zophobas morio]|uniref:Uncharacterized protein n=1 Tax=Zophobas morio TaxID=2755281 RepID=A0AA38IEY9_9CUCU|nr:hypothetical protein Zmor_018704 [Zophobas morio]